jgi:hypothetical protein
MNNSQVIFKGNAEAVKKFRRRTMYWLVAAVLLTIPFFIYSEFFAPYSPQNHWKELSDSGFWMVIIGCCITIFIFSSLAMIPQNLEIREDGIAPPTRGYIEALKGRERFIKYSEIHEIVLGETPIEYEIVLRNGKHILVGIGGAFFLELSVQPSRIGKFDRVFRAVKEKLDEIKWSGNKGEIVLNKEEILERARKVKLPEKVKMFEEDV